MIERVMVGTELCKGEIRGGRIGADDVQHV